MLRLPGLTMCLKCLGYSTPCCGSESSDRSRGAYDKLLSPSPLLLNLSCVHRLLCCQFPAAQCWLSSVKQSRKVCYCCAGLERPDS